MFFTEPLRIDLFNFEGNAEFGEHIFGILVNNPPALLVRQTVGVERKSRQLDLGRLLFSLLLLAFSLPGLSDILLDFLIGSFVLRHPQILLSLY